MTAGGGSNGFGVIFSFDPSTSTYTRLKDFDGIVSGAFPNGSLVQAGNGKLYGMTNSGGNSQQGVIFSFDPSTYTYTKLKDFVYNSIDGSAPLGSLMLASNGKLYGMTWNGGSNLLVLSFPLILPLPLTQSSGILIKPMAPTPQET